MKIQPHTYEKPSDINLPIIEEQETLFLAATAFRKSRVEEEWNR